jgi:hypothetical protein
MRKAAIVRGFAAVIGLIAAVLCGSVRAQTPVDLQLVFAVDVSRSIDADESRLQRDGYIAALTHPRVVKAITGGPLGRIAVAYFEWANASYQRILVPWTVIANEKDARAVAAILAEEPVASANWTSLSGAIDSGVSLLAASSFASPRRVIDISGDGRNNNGRPAADARDEAVRQGIVINGLPIINDKPNFGGMPERDLDVYFRQNVIGGPGAFIKVAQGFDSFGEAILQKLVIEISGIESPQQFAGD